MENKVSSGQKNFRSSKLLSVHVQVYVFRRESLNFTWLSSWKLLVYSFFYELEAIRLNSKCDDDNGSDNNDDDDDDDHNNHDDDTSDSVDDDDTRVRVELSCNSLAGFTREELRRQHLNMIGNILVIILMSVGSLQMFRSAIKKSFYK